MEVRTIKDVDTATWGEFKKVAAKAGKSLGKTFKDMLRTYQKQGETLWQEILKGEKILDDAEAKALLAEVKKLRREGGFR